MVYYIACHYKAYWSLLNIFHYVSVRGMAAMLTSLIISFLFGQWFITFCQRNFRSKVREYTPESHQHKNDTPTMGGLFMLALFLLNGLLWNDLSKPLPWIFMFCVASFGLIGFWDDWQKIAYHKGISAKLKFRLQVLCATITVGLWYSLMHPNTHLCIPFFKNTTPDLSFLIIPWAVFVILAMSNAVNLTDGLDGLATGPLIANFATFSLIAYLAGHIKFAQYLFIPFAGTAELTIFGASLVGALLGFLWYNTYPAEIFMGDVGALSLGAGLALMALMARQELLLLIAGGIFVMETVSVVIQVASFKLFGRRVFRMAPIHHHFELLGWKETKITVRFWIISMILGLITILTLKMR
ncbi:MAG: phospho-N-acetylmuramoyl-pentapeptide-transferase [Candidatus Babeliales bacterium]